MPLIRHEDIIIFSKFKIGNFTYNKQYRKGKPFKTKHIDINEDADKKYHSKINNRTETINTGLHNPCSIIEIKSDLKIEKGLHPTQKPIELFKYLIKTYSNENDLILDCFAGSGTTAIAAMDCKRNFVCIEKDKNYYEIARKRIENFKLKENKHGQKYRIIE
jgi:site-specific DNA-methyltransferase (adenine-specific)